MLGPRMRRSLYIGKNIEKKQNDESVADTQGSRGNISSRSIKAKAPSVWTLFEWYLSSIFQMATAAVWKSYLVTEHLSEPLLLVVNSFFFS